MKKLLTLSAVLSSALFFAQGKLYLHNFTDYNLAIRVKASNPASCVPAVAASMNFPAQTQDVINNFNDSLPYASYWTAQTTPGGPNIPHDLSTQGPSGLLTALSPLTQWNFLYYGARDPITNQPVYDTVNFYMGDPSLFPNCSEPGSTHIDGTYTEAFWFYMPSENATYLIVQP